MKEKMVSLSPPLLHQHLVLLSLTLSIHIIFFLSGERETLSREDGKRGRKRVRKKEKERKRERERESKKGWPVLSHCKEKDADDEDERKRERTES